jgi:hypothetical protein
MFLPMIRKMFQRSFNMKNTQAKFCQWLVEEGHTNPSEVNFGRTYLKSVALKKGMKAAPGWIVNDPSRIVSRGVYSVPELATYLASMNQTANA